MSNIQIIRNGFKLDNELGVFPSGEIKVKLLVRSTTFAAKTLFWELNSEPITILARLNNSNDILELIMIVDALREVCDYPINLFLPKVPYAQQDRVCDAGESLSIRAFAKLINSLSFSKVTIIDPHSTVTKPLINGCKVIEQLVIINQFIQLNYRMTSGNIQILSPDKGSIEKTTKIAKYFNFNDFVKADKLRNLATGEIIETVVYCEDFKKNDVIIFDDICLGGKTFTELAKIVKARNSGKVLLFVTHGVFSAGLETLFDNGIDEIYTTNSYRTDLTESEKLHIFDIEKHIKF